MKNLWDYSAPVYHFWYLKRYILDSSIASNRTSLLKLFKSIFNLQSQILHQPRQYLEAFYLPTYKIYTTTDCRNLGFLITPFFYIYKFPIQFFILCVISFLQLDPYLGSCEAKGALECPHKDIGWY